MLERYEDGSCRFETNLKEVFDGCKMELLYNPEGEVELSLVDSGSKVALAEIYLQTERIFHFGSEVLSIKINGGDKKMTTLAFDTDRRDTTVIQYGVTETAKFLAAWWLSQNIFPVVMIDDDLFTKEKLEEEIEQYYIGELN